MTQFNRKQRGHRPSHADRYKAQIDRYYQIMKQGLKDQPDKQGEAPARSPAELLEHQPASGENGNGFHDAEKDRAV